MSGSREHSPSPSGSQVASSDLRSPLGQARMREAQGSSEKLSELQCQRIGNFSNFSAPDFIGNLKL